MTIYPLWDGINGFFCVNWCRLVWLNNWLKTVFRICSLHRKWKLWIGFGWHILTVSFFIIRTEEQRREQEERAEEMRNVTDRWDAKRATGEVKKSRVSERRIRGKVNTVYHRSDLSQFKRSFGHTMLAEVRRPEISVQFSELNKAFGTIKSSSNIRALHF